MITYDWNCKTVDAYVEQGGNNEVVYNVHWRVTGTKEEGEEQYTYTAIGTQELQTTTITDFVAFDQLTNAQLVTWTQDAIGTEGVDAIQANISSTIDLEINPVSVTLTVGDTAEESGESDPPEEPA